MNGEWVSPAQATYIRSADWYAAVVRRPAQTLPYLAASTSAKRSPPTTRRRVVEDERSDAPPRLSRRPSGTSLGGVVHSSQQIAFTIALAHRWRQFAMRQPLSSNISPILVILRLHRNNNSVCSQHSHSLLVVFVLLKPLIHSCSAHTDIAQYGRSTSSWVT